jgi:hypothetical protein
MFKAHGIYCQGLLYSIAIELTVAIQCYAILSLEHIKESGARTFPPQLSPETGFFPVKDLP